MILIKCQVHLLNDVSFYSTYPYMKCFFYLFSCESFELLHFAMLLSKHNAKFFILIQVINNLRINFSEKTSWNITDNTECESVGITHKN